MTANEAVQIENLLQEDAKSILAEIDPLWIKKMEGVLLLRNERTLKKTTSGKKSRKNKRRKK